MPLHLLPGSRRQFLASTLTAGVSVVLGRPIRGEEPSVDADRWVLLADSHIAARRDLKVRGVAMADNLARVVAEVAALKARPAGIVLDGDVAYSTGEAEDYTLAAKLLKPLVEARIPLHLTLGNHDHRQHFQAGLLRGAGRSPVDSRIVSVVKTDRANWFFLDSLDRVNKTPGELGKEQNDWLAKALDAHAGKPALVVVHHNPQWGDPDKRSGLVDTEQLFAVLVPRKQVKAVIFGHTHQWRCTRHKEIHLVNLPPTSYVFNKDAPNGWVDCRLREGGAVLTLHALDAKHKQNGETMKLSWR